jgi:PAS domain S-box-containing protein
MPGRLPTDVDRASFTNRAIRSSNDQTLRRVLDVVPVPIWIIDLSGRLKYANQAWKKATATYELPHGAAMWTDICHPDHRDAATARFFAAATKAAPFEIKVRLSAPRSANSWWSFEAAPYCDADGNLESYVGTCTDVTANHQAQQAMRRLTPKLIHAQETERRRIARELHDDVGQRLALLTAKLAGVSRAFPSASAEVRVELADARRQLVDLSTSVHVLSHQLHPAKLDLLGLAKTLESLCRDVSREHEREITFSAEEPLSTITGEVALCLFRIAQEALQNAIKHSAARRIRVHAWCDASQVGLQVIDDGQGFDPLAPPAPGLGLLTMRERVELLGGALRIDSAPSRGTVIVAVVPISSSATAR